MKKQYLGKFGQLSKSNFDFRGQTLGALTISSVSGYRELFYQRFFCRPPKDSLASSDYCRRVSRGRFELLKVSSKPNGWRTAAGVMETQGFPMVSAAPAVGASSAATRGSAGTGQEALAPVVHTAGALREARSRRTFAQNMHEFPCIFYSESE